MSIQLSSNLIMFLKTFQFSVQKNRSIYFLFFYKTMKFSTKNKKKKMLKWRFELISKQKKLLSGMKESRLAEFGFNYIMRKMESIIRRVVFCKMLCFIWKIVYSITQSVRNQQFKQLHENKSPKEICFRIWCANESMDHSWDPEPETFVLLISLEGGGR